MCTVQNIILPALSILQRKHHKCEMHTYIIRRRHIQNIVQIHNMSEYVRRRTSKSKFSTIKYTELPRQLGKHSLQSNIMPDSAQKLWQTSWLLSSVAETCRPEDLFDMYSAHACKSAMLSPVAFCPAVHFLAGILSGVVFVCGILSRGILSVHRSVHRLH